MINKIKALFGFVKEHKKFIFLVVPELLVSLIVYYIAYFPCLLYANIALLFKKQYYLEDFPILEKITLWQTNLLLNPETILSLTAILSLRGEGFLVDDLKKQRNKLE